MVIIKKIISVGEDIEKLGLSYTADGNVKWGDSYGKQSCSSPKC